ncbi:MAG: T9SS type A sorting domain-containing protein [Candidatus Cloacimonadota bacterium]|nr:T9SS type A sorting domain-containing protein [Candidatus Cloacimonadota bacterium]
MKKFIFIIFLILTYSISFAQIQWQDNGVPVRQGKNIVWNQTSVACEDNTFVSIWTDTRNGIRGVYAQKVDENGNLLWGENGIELYNPDRMQDHPIAISSTNNSVIICWQDYDAIEVYSSQIRVQKIDANGYLLWGQEGILLEESEANGWEPQMVKHSDGGVFIIWNETPQSDITGIRLLNDGSIADGWGQGIDLLPAMYEYDTHSDLMDGVILSTSLYDDIYIQRVDEDGSKLWGYNGTLLYNGDEDISAIDICLSIANEYYFAWRTHGSNDKIMMQKADSNGNPILEIPVTISEAGYIQRLLTICPSDSQPVITWIIGETILSQKIDSDGNLLWGEEGITVFESNYDLNKNSVILKEDYAGGCLISWVDYDNSYDESRIIVQKINENGNLLFGEDGLIIFESYEFNYYNLYSSLATSDQKYYLCWLDRVNDDASLFHQILDAEGNIYLEENGEELLTGLSGSVIDLKMLTSADNPIMIWIEERNNNNYQIFLQILNGDGSNVFVENGIPITADSNFYLYDFETVYGENSENIALVWAENRLGYQQIFAQGIDTEGNLLWADSTGICLTPLGFETTNPKISLIDNAGNDVYYIGWEDFSDFMDSRVTGQKIVDGNLEWGIEGKIIVDRDGNDKLTDIVENYYIWNSIGYNNQNIYCIMVDENGDPAPEWPEDGLEVCVEDGRQFHAHGIIIPQGLLIFWKDHRYGEYDVYGQIVTHDGNILWQEGGISLIEGDNNNDFNFNIHYNDALYIIWNEYFGENHFNYYIQKFNEDGEPLWQDGGVRMSYWTFSPRSDPVIASVEQDVLVVWEHRHIDETIHIKAQLVSPTGVLQYDLEGISICDEYMEQNYPNVYVNGTDAYISWIDHRSTLMGEEGLVSIPGIYAQKIYLEPTFAANELIEPIEILYNYPNPFNPETTISFSLTTEITETTEINIFNIKGQKVKKLPVILSDAQHRIEGSGRKNYSVTWNGTDKNNQPVASGVYFYQLNVDDEVIASKKCLLLK